MCTYMYMSQIGINLKKARIQAGMTQKEVESKLGLRSLSVKDYETERLKLPIEVANKFAKLYNTDLIALTSDDDKTQTSQIRSLSSIGHMLTANDTNIIFLDPVIRAHIEEHSDNFFEKTIFDLIIANFTSRQKKSVMIEILKTLGSLMGADKKITENEMIFYNNLLNDLGLEEHTRSISRSFTTRHSPNIQSFNQVAALKHFTIWLMFLMAKSDSKISPEELIYTEECAELLKINRSNFLSIKNHFKSWF